MMAYRNRGRVILQLSNHVVGIGMPYADPNVKQHIYRLSLKTS